MDKDILLNKLLEYTVFILSFILILSIYFPSLNTFPKHDLHSYSLIYEIISYHLAFRTSLGIHMLGKAIPFFCV